MLDEPTEKAIVVAAFVLSCSIKGLNKDIICHQKKCRISLSVEHLQSLQIIFVCNFFSYRSYL